MELGDISLSWLILMLLAATRKTTMPSSESTPLLLRKSTTLGPSSGRSEALFPLVVLATLAGPSIAGILMTGLAYGKAGLRELLSRLTRWRVGVRWHAVALLTAPLTMLAALLALSLVSSAFRLLLFVVDDPLGLLVFSVVMGLMIDSWPRTKE